jgi:anti-sigma regulatory factor (Ser/Thr protein kinase)
MPETVTLPGRPDMVAIARAATRALLAGYPCAQDAELIVSEAATNSVRYSRSSEPAGTFQISIDAKPGLVRLEITDDGPTHGLLQFPTGEDLPECGRGLLIVDYLATRWGHDRGHGYAAIWAEIEY